MIYKFFDKKYADSGVSTLSNKSAFNNEIKENLQLAEELHEPIIRNFKKRTVCSGFKDSIWGADLADLQIISKSNKGIRFLLYGIDIFSKYAWFVPLNDRKGVTIVSAFQNFKKY